MEREREREEVGGRRMADGECVGWRDRGRGVISAKAEAEEKSACLFIHVVCSGS